MFTGLIEGVGSVRGLQKGGDLWSLSLTAPFDLSSVSLGDSVAVSGVCLTVVSKDSTSLTVQVSKETVGVTTIAGLSVGHPVNLERAMVLGGRLDGHLVQGHVDTVGRVERLASRGQSMEIWFRVPKAFGRYIIPKGSVAVDGVSLTVNEVVDSGIETRFCVTIIPHTGRKTTLASLVAGGLVNVETDLLGRYVERLLATGRWAPSSEIVDEAYLIKKGF